MLRLLPGKWIAAGAIALAVIGMAVATVRTNAQLRVENAELRRAVETWERIRDADLSRGIPADDVEWLRRRAGR